MMEVEFTEEVTVTGTASVCIDDIRAALAEWPERLDYTMEHANDKVKAYTLLRCMNDMAQVCKAVTDEMIAGCEVSSRKLLADFFEEQSKRWRERQPPEEK